MSDVFILNSRKVSQLCLTKHLSLYKKQPCLVWARLLSMAGSASMVKKTKAGFQVPVGNGTLVSLAYGQCLEKSGWSNGIAKSLAN